MASWRRGGFETLLVKNVWFADSLEVVGKVELLKCEKNCLANFLFSCGELVVESKLSGGAFLVI
jgi:hypothetical protein